MFHKTLLSAATLGFLLMGAAEAQTLRDLTPEQATAFQVTPIKSGSLEVLTILDRQDATYALGETVRLAVKANEDAYVTVFNVGASGKVVQLFPNAFQTDNRVKAGEAVEIPAAASGTQIRVSGPVGGELIKIIATSKPVTIVPDSRLAKSAGIFRSLDDGVDGLKRDLDIATSNPPADLKVAVVDQVLKTITSRTAPAIPVVGAAPQTFPLLLAADKPSYRVGEHPTIAVTSLQACHLTVWSTNATGQVRILFPTSSAPSDQIGAQQTLMISGGPSGQTVVASAPGTEILTALCTSEARSLPFTPKSATDLITNEERAALDRSLAAVPSRTTGTHGLAQVSVAVIP